MLPPVVLVLLVLVLALALAIRRVLPALLLPCRPCRRGWRLDLPLLHNHPIGQTMIGAAIACGDQHHRCLVEEFHPQSTPVLKEAVLEVPQE